ncbi:MAG: TonB-dependent receptor [Gemmatimonadaceae bacterium]
MFARHVLRSARLALTALLVGSAALGAQEPTGRITGRVIDPKSGLGIADVAIQVVGIQVGGSLGTRSGVDGRYSLSNVRAGTVTMHARRLGFQPKTITGILVPAGQAVEQDIALSASTVTLAAVTVSAEKERGSVNQALDQQRNAAGVVNSITAEQISRSPDGDAAQAVQRVSGVSVQDGKYVFVRGLGERYTTTSLNGARMPSPEPERKVVPLDLFPTGLLQSITTSKTFTPDQPGDFSGASVDIRTREFPATRTFAFSATGGMNAQARGANLPFAPGVGGEAFAMAGRSRWLPSYVAQLGDLTTATQAQQNEIVNQFRNVWRPGTRGSRPNGSFSASLGGNDPLLGQRIGYLLSGTYSYSQEVRPNVERATALAVGDGTFVPVNRFQGRMGSASALWGGLANFSTMLGSSSRLSLNNTYTRTADNEAVLERGTYETLALPVAIDRMDYVERAVWSSQLQGETTRGAHALTWALSASGVTRDEPDRSEFATELRTDPSTGAEQRLWLNTLPEGAVRTFATLGEDAREARADYRLAIGGGEWLSLKLGGLARRVDRDADVRSYGLMSRALGDSARALPPERLFGGQFTAADSDRIQVRSLSQGGSYTASDRLAAGYGMLDYAPSIQWRIVGGARVERSRVAVNAISTLRETSTATREFTDVLPSLSVTFRPTNAQNVRASVTRTLARPEYREMADVRTRDALGGVDVRGNPDLVRTLIDNADLRWEWYPTTGEVLSVGLFAKRFSNPIERVFRASSANSLLTYVNAESADNLGVELEARKGLGFLAAPLDRFTVFSNATLMRSRIHLGARETANTTANRAMMGQAPYVFNAGLTWATRARGASATLLFNRVGERITDAGESPLPDVIQRPRNVLDFSLRAPMKGDFKLRFDARNLLDAAHVVTQGGVIRQQYSTGRTVQLGVAFQP